MHFWSSVALVRSAVAFDAAAVVLVPPVQALVDVLQRCMQYACAARLFSLIGWIGQVVVTFIAVPILDPLVVILSGVRMLVH